MKRLLGVVAVVIAMVMWEVLPAGAAVTWTVQPSPTPPRFLSAVSCLSAGDCTSVGERKILHWNGHRWTVQANAPANGDLVDIDCSSARSCTAVGALNEAGGNSPVRLLAAIWNGVRWKVQAVPSPVAPSPGVNMSFNAVECLSPANCLAVGFYSLSGGTSRVLIEKWNGVRWRIQRSPIRRGTLNDVACQSTTSCFAVGDTPTSTPDVVSKILVEHWNGSKWTVQAVPSVPSPPGTERAPTLAGISCPGSRVCTAVGTLFFDYFSPSSFEGLPLALRWNGTRWVRQRVTLPAGTFNSINVLNGVACISANRCVAVGSSRFDIHSGSSTFVMAWNGTRWAVQQAVNPPGFFRGFFGVDCTTVCTAVGGRATIGNVERSLVEVSRAFS
jgi:hypothetical protein